MEAADGHFASRAAALETVARRTEGVTPLLHRHTQTDFKAATEFFNLILVIL